MENFLALLSRRYRDQGKSLLLSVLVNSKYYIHEEYAYDNWDGGQSGHAVHFQVPPDIYYKLIDELAILRRQVCSDLNQISDVQGEWVADVFFEMQDDPTLMDWREESGVLTQNSNPAKAVESTHLRRIWPAGYLRVFLSHKSDHREAATVVKDSLAYYGISCFVAHNDIEPSHEWQKEIERALFSMEVMMPLLTPGFSDSKWTDQELGVAIGRDVPILLIKLGIDPYGFIGKYQALSAQGKPPRKLAKEVLEVLLHNFPAIKDRIVEGLVAAFEKAGNFDQANVLMGYLDKVRSAPPAIIERLERAPKANSQVREAYEVNRRLPGLLKRLRGST